MSIVVAKRIIDWVGLNAKPIPESWLQLYKDINPVLALMQGMGSDGAKLLQTDASGSLVVTTTGQAVAGPVRIQDGAAASLLSVTTLLTSDLAGNNSVPASIGVFSGGASAPQLRGASAINIAAQSGFGVALVANPGEWTVVHEPATGVAASASRVAGGAGVRHVCRSISLGWGCAVAPAATAFFMRLRDGVSGAGTILLSIVGSIQAVAGAGGQLALSNLNIPGSAATAMTLEFSTGIPNVNMTASMSGYDAS